MWKTRGRAVLSVKEFLVNYERLLDRVLQNRHVTDIVAKQVCGKMRFVVDNSGDLNIPEVNSLMACAKKYLKFVCLCVESEKKPDLFVQTYCTVISDIAKLSCVQDVFLDIIGGTMLDLLENEKRLSRYCMEILLCFNRSLKNLEMESVHEYYGASCDHLSRLADIILICQNISYQFIILQTLCNMCPKKDWEKYTNLIYHVNNLQEALRDINKEDFYKGTRQFLNAVNEGRLHLFSIKCQIVTIDKIDVVFHETLPCYLSDHWIDFDVSTNVVNIICHKNALQSFVSICENDEALQPISIKASSIGEVQIIRFPEHSDNLWVVHFALMDPQAVFVEYSGLSASVKFVKIAVTNSSEFERFQKCVLHKMFSGKIKTMKMTKSSNAPLLAELEDTINYVSSPLGQIKKDIELDETVNSEKKVDVLDAFGEIQQLPNDANPTNTMFPDTEIKKEDNANENKENDEKYNYQCAPVENALSGNCTQQTSQMSVRMLTCLDVPVIEEVHKTTVQNVDKYRNRHGDDNCTPKEQSVDLENRGDSIKPKEILRRSNVNSDCMPTYQNATNSESTSCATTTSTNPCLEHVSIEPHKNDYDACISKGFPIKNKRQKKSFTQNKQMQNEENVISSTKKTYDVNSKIMISNSKCDCNFSKRKKLFDPNNMSYLKYFEESNNSINGDSVAHSSEVKYNNNSADKVKYFNSLLKLHRKKKEIHSCIRKTSSRRKSTTKNCHLC